MIVEWIALNRVFTVTELNERIRDRLETDIRLHDLWARGELSNVTNHRSGHRYFTIKDRESQLSCVLFRNQDVRIGFELKNGLNVLVFGDIDVYRARGQVQLIARGIRLDSGLGLRQIEFDALKNKLAAEGLFSLDRKRSLPRYPSCIGVVTSLDGAALRDVIKTIGPYPARIMLSPAQVQGDGAPESIALAIRSLHGRADVVIVCRGGGSAEDLWAFNSEIVCRAIFDCDSPVISAIGHETDITIADFVADVRAATPTAAAKMAVPDTTEIKIALAHIGTRMARALWSCLEIKRDRLDYLNRSISARRMYSSISMQRRSVDRLEERLLSAEASMIELHRKRLELAEGRLSAVSPLATLSRGYALARSEKGKLILKAEDVAHGDLIEVILSEGRLVCRVLEKDEGDSNGPNGSYGSCGSNCLKG
ncbi:MAG: exodeoxyribonuclease VII large subunit [Methanotrichaceae archaeon]